MNEISGDCFRSIYKSGGSSNGAIRSPPRSSIDMFTAAFLIRPIHATFCGVESTAFSQQHFWGERNFLGDKERFGGSCLHYWAYRKILTVKMVLVRLSIGGGEEGDPIPLKSL